MATATKTRIDRLLERQNAEIDRLADAQARRVLRALEDARRELRERLLDVDDAATPFTAQQLRGMLAQVESGVFQLRDRFGEVLADGEREAHTKALDHLIDLVKANEPDFEGAIPAIRLQAASALSERRALLLHRHSVNRYGADLIDRIQRELVLGQVSGLSIRQVADRITATNASVFASLRGRAELIARMESNRVYNDGHLQSMKDLAAETDDPKDPDPLMKRADEFFDNRNHPLSRVLHGRTAKLDDDFVVPRAEVEAISAVLKKGNTGIVWRLEGGSYRGQNYPAHFNDRGRIVAFRRSWENPTRFPLPKEESKPEPTSSELRAAAKAKLDKAEKALDRAGLHPEAWGIPESFRDEIDAYGRANPGANVRLWAGDLFAARPRFLPDGSRTGVFDLAPKAFEQQAEALRFRANVLRKSADPGDASAFDKWAKTLDKLAATQRKHVQARRAWLATLPESELAPIRNAAVDRMLDGWGPRQVNKVRPVARQGLSLFPVDLLEFAARSGVRVSPARRLSGAAAYYSPNGTGFGGRVALFTNHNLIPENVAHEFGHALDDLFQKSGHFGGEWRDAGGYKASRIWKRGIGPVFDSIRDDAGSRVIQIRSLGGSHWAGNWINPYEGRIYAANPLPTASDLRSSDAAGAIEFVSTMFERASLDALKLAKLRAPANPSDVVSLFGPQRGSGAVLFRDEIQRFSTSHRVLKASEQGAKHASHYGKRYVEAIEAVTGSGERTLRRLASDSSVKFAGDGDVVATAWLFQELHGIPVRKTLGPNGILAGKLSRPWDGKKLPRLTGSARAKEAQIFRVVDDLTGDDGTAVAAEEAKKLAAKKRAAGKVRKERLERLNATRRSNGLSELDPEVWFSIDEDVFEEDIGRHERRAGLSEWKGKA